MPASITKLLIATALFAASQLSLANLLINPTRVQIEPGDRSADVTLINTSEITNTYRLEWAEKRAKSEGGYEDLNETAAASFPTASQMLRFSPRQVTLKPGERQTIKLMVRRPQGLQDGEYRSHLLFKALPPNREENQQLDSAATAINIVLSFAIPVVVRQGNLQYQLGIDNAAIEYNPSQKTGAIEVDLSRSGIHSVTGNMTAYWTPAGGKEQAIAKLSDYNFWVETTKAKARLQWTGTDFALTDGKLRVVYEGSKQFRGQTFFDKTFSINRSMIKVIN